VLESLRVYSRRNCSPAPRAGAHLTIFAIVVLLVKMPLIGYAAR
jgi:hypothetical protein